MLERAAKEETLNGVLGLKDHLFITCPTGSSVTKAEDTRQKMQMPARSMYPPSRRLTLLAT